MKNCQRVYPCIQSVSECIHSLTLFWTFYAKECQRVYSCIQSVSECIHVSRVSASVSTRWHSFGPSKRKTTLISTLVHRALSICSRRKLQQELNQIRSFYKEMATPITSSTFISQRLFYNFSNNLKKDQKNVLSSEFLGLVL